jgi:cell wall-associated NlpC family hydrolase
VHRSSRAIVLALAVLAALVSVTSSAQASPVSDKKARLQAVEARLEAVGTKASIAVEGYNQATTRLGAVREHIKQNRKQLAAAQRDLDLANRQLTARAIDIYKTPDTGFLDVVLRSASFDDLISRYDLMSRVGNSDVNLVNSLAALRNGIRDRRIALAADERSAEQLVKRRAKERTQVLALQAQLQSMTRGIKADIQRLQAQQQAAAAAAVAAASARTAAGASGGSASSSGSSGLIPAVDPGGPGHPEVVAIAQRYLGIPYVWGGASPGSGFDCSGLVMYVYAQIGIGLSHGATDQQHASRPVPLSALQPGDLVFYGNASYSYHVAIYVGGGRTIEAARTGTPVRYGVVGAAWVGGRF